MSQGAAHECSIIAIAPILVLLSGNGYAPKIIIAALKIAATSCLIGAIVSEWIGADTGLGRMRSVEWRL